MLGKQEFFAEICFAGSPKNSQSIETKNNETLPFQIFLT